jgi:hypothetical protein
MNTPKIQNAENFHRSANAPVGIVAAVSMNTTWKRKNKNIPTSYEGPESANPLPPKNPQPPMVISWFRIAFPPRLTSGPTPPNIKPNPMK